MLQKKDYQATTKIPVAPTTIKKPIVENQTSGKIKKTNATKEGITTTTKIPVNTYKN